MSSIVFNKELFNPLFWHLWTYLRDDDVRTILLEGGSSAGKTYTAAQALALDGRVRNYSSIVFRKEQSVIKTTIKPEFIEVINSVFEHEALHDAYRKFDWEFRTESDEVKIVFKGLDKSDKIKGLSGFTKMYLDELDQFDLKDWNEGTRRLRGKKGQQRIASWNPVSEESWVYVDYIDKIEWIDLPNYIPEYGDWSILNGTVKRSEDGRTILINTTYLDNKWIVGGEIDGRSYGQVDNQCIADFTEMKSVNYDDYLIYAKGLRGTPSVSKPYFRNYNNKIHFSGKKFDYWEGEPIRLSFDFNNDPVSLIVNQMIHGWGVCTLRAYQESGGTEEMCKYLETTDLIDTDFTLWNIVGDVSGNSGQSSSKGLTDYGIIQDFFGLSDHQFENIAKQNPYHVYSRPTCNYFLHIVPYVIDSRCDNLDYDLRYAEVDDKGKMKKGRKDRHLADAWRYGIHDMFYEDQNFTAIERMRQFADFCKMEEV